MSCSAYCEFKLLLQSSVLIITVPLRIRVKMYIPEQNLELTHIRFILLLVKPLTSYTLSNLLQYGSNLIRSWLDFLKL